jgi:hypothetical protein
MSCMYPAMSWIGLALNPTIPLESELVHHLNRIIVYSHRRCFGWSLLDP